MKALYCIIISACLLLTIENAIAGDVVVIVNAENTQNLTAQDIKNIYSDNIVSWKNGNRIKVMNLPSSSVVREKFSKSILGVSAKVAAAREANWKITNRIKNPSITKRARFISSIVSRSVNAIGYIDRALIRKKDKVRIIKIKN